MLKHHNQILLTLLWIFDLLLAYVAWELAYQLRFYWLNLPPAQEIPSHYQYFKAVGVLVVFTGTIFIFAGVYRPHHIARLKYELLHLAKGCIWLFILLLATAFFYRKFSYSRIHVIYFMICFIGFLILSRLGTRMVLHGLHAKGIHIENVLVIGTSEVANRFTDRLKRYQTTGILLKGIVSVNNGTLPHDEIWNIPYLGTVDNLSQIISEQEIDQVFIALAAEEQSHIPDIREVLAEQMVDIRIIPDLGTFKTLHTDVEDFEGMPVVTIIQSPMVGWNLVLKRGMDFTGALTAIILFSPVMFLLSVLIKLTSPGPIWYKQERMGLDGVTFQTYKFRSMRLDAEKETGAVWASDNDERRTPIGAIMRKTSLDELPQLFNVLKGDMSLVGPRPERPVFIKDFKKKIPNYMLRHKVKAGITGWAQINGWRGNTSLEKRIEFDLFYIEHWSPWLDIKILFLTIFKGFIDPNAY